jgi:putative ABC transport system ATP-binding protein
MSDDLLIDVQNVNKSFPLGDSSVHILKDVSFQVRRGEFVAIVGQSGSGKSTLLNMITGVDRPSSGEVYVSGQRLTTMGENDLALWRRRSIGIIFQFFNLVPGLTIGQNVRLPMDLAKLYSKTEREERVHMLLDTVGLGDRLTWMPSRVSGGDQQRAAIARADANDPPLIFGDEPTGRRWVDSGKTFLMVTHSRALAEQTRRTIEIADGRIVRDERH